MTLKEKIDALVELEWGGFHNVKNEGGQASCQRDDETFYIMRSSQFSVWSEEMIDSYTDDLQRAFAAGRNLPAEKYAWMEAITAPKKFETLKELLLQPTELSLQFIEEITKIQTAWMEEYAAQYPYVAAGNRYIRQKDAPPYATSFETYTWGELHTYSERTLALYAKRVLEYKQAGVNMVTEIMQATVKQYGYEDLDECEAVTKKRYE